MVSIWPIEGGAPKQWSWHKAKLAMAVAGNSPRYLFKDIERRHFNAMAPQFGYGKDAEPIIRRLIERTDDVIEQVLARLPTGFPQQVADAVFQGLKLARGKLQGMPP